MLQAVVFDNDGTLSQTFERQFSWFQHWSATHDKSFLFSSIRDFRVFYNSLLDLEGGVGNVYKELGLPCDMSDRNHPVWGAYECFKRDHPVSLYPGVKDAVESIWRLGSLSRDDGIRRRLRLGVNT